MSQYITKSELTSAQIITIIDVVGASLCGCLAAIAANPVIVALGNEELAQRKALKDAKESLTEAFEVSNEALNTLKSLRDDLIHCNESPATPIPEVTEADLDQLFADIQADCAYDAPKA